MLIIIIIITHISVEIFRRLPSLRSLSLCFNDVIDISPLSSLPLLRNLGNAVNTITMFNINNDTIRFES